MNLKCLFGHQWNDSCMCERCGEIRDEMHNWTPLEGKCREKCSVCGEERTIDHKWNGCICERCGVIRDVQHTWERSVDKCIEKCLICGKECEKHTWVKGECLICGLKIAELKSLKTIKLSNIITPEERGVLVNVFSYALKNWGNPTEEIEIKKIMQKISNDNEFVKSDVFLLNRVFSLMLQLFPNNNELHIKGMFSLRDEITKNMI